MRSKSSRRDHTESSLYEAWSKGKPADLVRSARTDSTVLSVRMRRSTLRLLTEAARDRGKGPATLARELIEQGLASVSGGDLTLAARVLERLLEASTGKPTVREKTGESYLAAWRSFCSPFNEFRSHIHEQPLLTRAPEILGYLEGSVQSPGPEPITQDSWFSLFAPVSEEYGSGWWRNASLGSSTKPAAKQFSDERG